MKNKILALLATIGLASSVSAVEINKNLSINGFIDGSWQDRSEDHTNAAAPHSNDSQDVSLDEVELNFLLNVGNVSGEIHLDNQDPFNGDIENVNVEQAHFTYTLDNGLSITFGRYGSKLGLEREDPAGLYTYSRAYGDGGEYAGTSPRTQGPKAARNYGDVDSLVREGVAFGYAAETFALNVSLDQSVDDNLKDSGEGINTEIAISYTGVDNLVANVGYRAEQVKGTNADTDHINVNATYTMGKALIAAEWQEASNDTVAAATNGDIEAYQFLVDYDFNDKLGAAIRYSNEDQDAISTTGLEISKFTIAPNYAITDSLGLIVEYTTADVDSAPGAESDDYDFIAAELTFTF
jgi:hypothetical protein